MPAREFRGLIHNDWDEPLFRIADEVREGDWQDPWLPSKVPGAGKIDPSKDGEWRSESDGIARGTSGWARWASESWTPSKTRPSTSSGFKSTGAYRSCSRKRLTSTCAVFRNDPGTSDPFATVDQKPPDLEIVPKSVNGSDISNVVEMIPYVLTIPASFFADALFHEIALLQVNFVVRRRASSQASPLTFPSGVPTREQTAMAAFRNRMQSSLALGFLGGFPNFYESVVGRDHVGGTVLIRPKAGQWHDVPLANLGNASLSDFVARIRATNSWAIAQLSLEGSAIDVSGQLIRDHLFVGGFPTFSMPITGRESCAA